MRTTRRAAERFRFTEILDRSRHRQPCAVGRLQAVATTEAIEDHCKFQKGTSSRLIVSGEIDVKEIERLMAKLELDEEILAERPDDGLSITERARKRAMGE